LPLKTVTQLEGRVVTVEPRAAEAMAAVVPATTPTAAAVARG